MFDLTAIRRELFALSLELGSIQVDMRFPFRWASGYMMPIYNDSRLLLSSPRARQLIAAGLEQLAQQSEMAQPCQNIAGVATGGIAHALLLAERWKLPMQYVRSSAKAHGLSRKIEGLPGGERSENGYRGQSVLLIEDVISTGESCLKAAEALRQAGAAVSSCLAVYSYAFPKAERAFADSALTCSALLSFPQLLEYMAGAGDLSRRNWSGCAHGIAARLRWCNL